MVPWGWEELGDRDGASTAKGSETSLESITMLVGTWENPLRYITVCFSWGHSNMQVTLNSSSAYAPKQKTHPVHSPAKGLLLFPTKPETLGP